MNFSFCKFTDGMNGHNRITETAGVGANENQQIKIRKIPEENRTGRCSNG